MVSWSGLVMYCGNRLQTTISKSDYLYVSLIAVSQLTLTDRFNMQDIFCDYLIQMKIVWVHLCLGFVVIKYYHHTFEDKCWLSIQLLESSCKHVSKQQLLIFDWSNFDKTQFNSYRSERDKTCLLSRYDEWVDRQEKIFIYIYWKLVVGVVKLGLPVSGI